MPLRNMHIAFATLMLPMLAGVRGTARFGWLISLATVAAVVGSAAYWVPVVLFHHRLLAWLYGGRYEGYAVALWFFGFYLLGSAAADILTTGLRALPRPDLVFRANILATAATVMLGAWAVARWGVAGAAGAYALSSATRAIVMCWYCRNRTGTTFRLQMAAGEKPTV